MDKIPKQVLMEKCRGCDWYLGAEYGISSHLIQCNCAEACWPLLLSTG